MHINLENQDRPDKTAVDLRLYHFGYESCLAAQAWGPGIKDHFKYMSSLRAQALIKRLKAATSSVLEMFFSRRQIPSSAIKPHLRIRGPMAGLPLTV